MEKEGVNSQMSEFPWKRIAEKTLRVKRICVSTEVDWGSGRMGSKSLVE
jgi:hypothetical protein